MSSFPASNRTYQIIHDAAKRGYAVGGYCVYNTDGVLAVIRAAERCRSPAIIQVFPWTLHFQGRHFIQFIASAAHGATVPISVHLDHCLQPSDADLALDCAFDSIMVDGSMFDEEQSIAYVKRIVEKGREKGITIEAELGRMEGGEDGLPKIEGSLLTDPKGVKSWVERTGVHFLAPSFGNVHGPYPQGGAEKWWQVDRYVSMLDRLSYRRAHYGRLKEIYEALGPQTPLVLHGTHPCSDDMFKTGIASGIRKVNLNRTVRNGYMNFLSEESGKLELTQLQERGVQIYSEEVERLMVVLGSVGKA
ncbi:fructose/tagatose bisphosphate aldolase [Pleomassaria siparia CBS 279.74]|uniref:Fructose-bisphosphate aldolase n=1 Tax=Pleomassaria siparia CBS 279.74 TaxID=1314801 RepID=A0A6G1JUQ0_9PLEO|nr:fructose/tagatose bisphosphate aldolase [Pleomassaria siparia CBS 279.74]